MNTADRNIDILIDELIQLDDWNQLVKLQKMILGRLQPDQLHEVNKAQYNKISDYLETFAEENFFKQHPELNP